MRASTHAPPPAGRNYIYWLPSVILSENAFENVSTRAYGGPGAKGKSNVAMTGDELKGVNSNRNLLAFAMLRAIWAAFGANSASLLVESLYFCRCAGASSNLTLTVWPFESPLSREADIAVTM